MIIFSNSVHSVVSLFCQILCGVVVQTFRETCQKTWSFLFSPIMVYGTFPLKITLKQYSKCSCATCRFEIETNGFSVCLQWYYFRSLRRKVVGVGWAVSFVYGRDRGTPTRTKSTHCYWHNYERELLYGRLQLKLIGTSKFTGPYSVD